MNKRLADRPYLAGEEYTIADIACIGWAKLWERQGQNIEDFPNMKRWLDAVLARPGVQRGFAVKVDHSGHIRVKDPGLRAVLERQKAR